MLRRRKREETPTADFSDQFAALFERVKNLEARVEALERTIGKSPAPPPPPLQQQEVKEGVVRGKTKRPFLEE
jgi:hypothetical protein